MDSPPRRANLRLAGLLASALALLMAWAVSVAVPRAAFFPGALAELIVRATPGEVATFFIEALGHWALRLLTIGAVAGCLLVGGEALAASASRHGPRPYWAATTLAAGAAVVLVAGSPGASTPVPALVALVPPALVYGAAAARLYELAATGTDAPDGGRRRVLRTGLGWVAAATLGAGVVGWLARRLSGPDTDVALAAVDKLARIPARPSWPEIEGLSREVTSPTEHYVVDINLYRPAIEVGDWRLEIKGQVDRRLALSFAELQSRFPVVEEYATLTCVSNEVGGDLVGHSLWGGVRLRDVLDAAGARPGAVDVVFRAADGYSDSIPLDVARDPAVLLAVAQNRRPLTRDHGFPCRVRVPPIYGMKNVKWITSIEVVASDYVGYWQQRGWSDEAVVRTQSRVDVAGQDGRIVAGTPTTIAGVAWAGDRRVSAVEVSTNGGKTWSEARLRPPIGPLSWRQWLYRWTPEVPGEATVMCRATDGEGNIQTGDRLPPHPAGATGLHAVTVEIA